MDPRQWIVDEDEDDVFDSEADAQRAALELAVERDEAVCYEQTATGTYLYAYPWDA